MEGASKQAQRSGGFELRLQNTAQFMQRLFMEAPSLYRVQMAPRRGNGSWRGFAVGESGFGSTQFKRCRGGVNFGNGKNVKLIMIVGLLPECAR